MTLSLAEKTILLLYGTDIQPPGQAPNNALESRLALDDAQVRLQMIGGLLIELLLQGRLRLKRPALFAQCRWCYLLLVFTMLFLGLAALLVPVIYSSVGALSLFNAVVVSIACLLLWYVAFFILGHLISGRLLIEETPAQDASLNLVLERMRQRGQAKTCQTYWRHLARWPQAIGPLDKMKASLAEQGYTVKKDLPETASGVSQSLSVMNLNHPECQELRDQLRAFLLTGSLQNRQIAALVILLSPRMLPRKQRVWPQHGLYACFVPEEYQVIRTRLKAIKAQKDQAILSQLGVTTYQALLTICNFLAT
jgi:hypothetical protein